MLTSPSHTVISEQQLPQDTIQAITFFPDSSVHLFALGGWDGVVCLFDLKEQGVVASKAVASCLFTTNIECPVLSLKWMPAEAQTLIISGGDGGVYFLRCNTTPPQVIKGITTDFSLYSGFALIEQQMIIMTVSPKKKLRYWRVSQLDKPIKELDLRSEPLCADSNEVCLLMALTDNYLGFVKFSDEPFTVTYMNINLDIVANSIALCTKPFYEFVVGTLDGRLLVGEVVVSMSSRTLNRKIAFKAHKTEEGYRKKVLHVVNSVGFTDEVKTDRQLVYSVGNEGCFKLWDLKKRETIFDLSFTDTKKCISYCAVSPDKKFLVIAFGYDWSQGVWGLKNDITPVSVIVHPLPN